MSFVYKCLNDLTPSYVSLNLQNGENRPGLRSGAALQMSVPGIRMELGKRAFNFFGPSSWNLRRELKIIHMTLIGQLKVHLKV